MMGHRNALLLLLKIDEGATNKRMLAASSHKHVKLAVGREFDVLARI